MVRFEVSQCTIRKCTHILYGAHRFILAFSFYGSMHIVSKSDSQNLSTASVCKAEILSHLFPALQRSANSHAQRSLDRSSYQLLQSS